MLIVAYFKLKEQIMSNYNNIFLYKIIFSSWNNVSICINVIPEIIFFTRVSSFLFYLHIYPHQGVGKLRRASLIERCKPDAVFEAHTCTLAFVRIHLVWALSLSHTQMQAHMQSVSNAV